MIFLPVKQCIFLFVINSNLPFEQLLKQTAQKKRKNELAPVISPSANSHPSTDFDLFTVMITFTAELRFSSLLIRPYVAGNKWGLACFFPTWNPSWGENLTHPKRLDCHPGGARLVRTCENVCHHV